MRFVSKKVVTIVLLMLLRVSINVPTVRNLKTQSTVDTIHPIWNITYGGSRADEGWGADTDNNGDIYFAGFVRMSAFTADVFVLKFAQNGSVVWSTSWDNGFDDEAFIVTVKDEYVYVGGRTFKSFSLASADMFILKLFASNGSLVWSQKYDGGHGYDEVDGLVVDSNSVYVAGWITGGSTQTDIGILKYDVNGTLIWSHAWGTTGVDEANGQIGVDENCVYVVGHYNALPLGIGGDAVLVAFNKTDGSYLWHKTWGGSNLDDAFGMAITQRFIFSVGITNSFDGDSVFLLKYDKKGNLLWNTTWGGEKSEVARAIDVTAEGNYVCIAANTVSYGQGDFDVVLLEYGQDGNLLYAKTWGGPMLDQAHGMAVHENYAYVAGETRSFGKGNEDAFLLKVDIKEEPVSFEISNLLITPDSVYVGETITISVVVTNTGGTQGSYNVTLRIDNQNIDERTVSLDIGENTTVTFNVSANQKGTFSVDINGLTGSFTVKEKRQCIIATATYGSELSPEVQFLREFRDKYVLKTFAGRNFMTAFDTWYYSFSPSVASIIANNNPIREVMKILLYPLLATLHISSTTFHIFSFNPELGITIAGLTAASLIGTVYFSPFLLIFCKIRKIKLQTKHLYFPLLILICTITGMVIAENIQNQNLMMVSTSIFILNTMSLATLYSTVFINSFRR